MLQFYDNDMSVCAQKVRIVLAAKGLPFERHHLNLRAGDQFSPEYRKLNPKAVVPTLVDDGQPIIESTVIIAYLDDAYPEPSLAPADAVGRAAMLQWMIRPDASLHDACGLTSFSLAFRKQLQHMPPDAFDAFVEKMPDPKRRVHIRAVVEQGLDAPGVAPALSTYAQAVGAMAAPLANNPWLTGDRWTLADATMLPYVLRAEHLGLTWMWDDAQAVADWLARNKALDAYAAIDQHLDPKYLELMGSIPPHEIEKARDLAHAS